MRYVHVHVHVHLHVHVPACAWQVACSPARGPFTPSRHVTAHRRGYVLGLSDSVDKSTGIFSPLLGGLLFDQLGAGAPALAACAVTAIGVVAAVVGLEVASAKEATKVE